MATIKLAEYLFIRLHELGVRSVFGVPGDYNLSLLDYVEPSGLQWVGTCNELNAGYAADAYARIKGVSALITTFGVGELSAVNAIAGAYAEKAPIIHIVGTPERKLQDSRARIHHTFNDGEYRRFAQMHSHVTVAQTNLRDHRTSPAQIDGVLEQCLLHSRPVYIELPADMVRIPVPRANAKLDPSIPISPPEQPSSNENAALSLVCTRIKASKQPMILVDGEIGAFGIVEEVNDMIKTTGFPTWTTSFGKGLVDETLPNVYGVYSGPLGDLGAKEFVDSCDLILCFGPHYSSTNTYQFSTIPNPSVTISFTATAVQAGSELFQDLPVKHVLKTLFKSDQFELPTKTHDPVLHQTKISHQHASHEPISQSHFWHCINPFLRPGDIVLAETGTAGYGTRDFSLPQYTRYFSPVTWLSIGYMLPATLGASIAQRELTADNKWNGINDPRTVLFIGDGSLQMTVQELSTIIHEKLNVVVFVINNDGYTIERCIHGRKQRYNDVATWRYLLAPAFFGADDEGDYRAQTFTVRNWGHVERLVADHGIMYGKGLRMVEVLMEREDAPKALLTLLDKQKERERNEETSE